MNSKTYITNYDHLILIVYFVLMLIGLYMQLNISSVRTSMSFFYKQFLWMALSLASVWFAFKKIDLEKLRRMSFLLIVTTVILLIAVLIFGRNVKGAVRSIQIGGINIQPSLLARITIIIYYAYILDKKQRLLPQSSPGIFFSHFNQLIVITALIFWLILLERHFSPLIISGLTLLSLLFLARVKLITIGIIISILFIMAIGIIAFGPKYRNERLQIYREYSLFWKNRDDRYSGSNDYQVRESLISLTSGKLFGTTPARGTGKHYFLPEAKTDYIFSIIGEEYGFLGALFIIGLYVLLFARTIIISLKKKDLFLQLLALGLGMNIFFNAIVNIGVAMAALPSTGVTLPFISYGGTSLLVNSVTIGLLLNISAERHRFG